jgi:hypothetical protein
VKTSVTVPDGCVTTGTSSAAQTRPTTSAGRKRLNLAAWPMDQKPKGLRLLAAGARDDLYMPIA